MAANRSRGFAGTLITLALALQLGRPCQAQSPARRAHAPLKLFTFTHPAMATTFTLYLYLDDAARASAVSDEVFDEVDRVEQLLSNYRESSELSRIDREAAAAPVTTDPEMMQFLADAEHWSRASDGAFDITVGRLMKAWGFYRHRGAVPPDDELERLRAVTGWQKVQLDEAARTVRFTAPGVELDPGGIGKGFAVDAAVRILREDGVPAALISAGSSTLYGLGAPPGRRGWRVVVPGPLPSKRTLSVVLLRNQSLSSADCSQKNFVANGHLYCHIMDPRTMHPVEGRIQVSIVDPSATASDALSNVIFVEPPEQSLRTLAASAPESRALIVSNPVSGDRASGAPSHATCTLYRWPGAIDRAHCPAPPTQPSRASKKK
jgi:thiamine biosynthesis lipoprotein